MDSQETLQDELVYQYTYEKTGCHEQKDILIVVHDQLHHIRKCIESLYAHTKNFTLYIWDNNSMAPTKEYLEGVSYHRHNIVLVRSPENLGFIKPNNELAKMGNSQYMILLNSDTEVLRGWDSALIGWLRNNEKCAVVGYQGSTLLPDGRGSGKEKNGGCIDYVCGWCMCLDRKKIYDKYGLFDEKNLSFAYAEDSDFSLRMKEHGFTIHAMNIKLVKHFGNATSIEVQKEMDTSSSFQLNHHYMRIRWKDYLESNRVDKQILLT